MSPRRRPLLLAGAAILVLGLSGCAPDGNALAASHAQEAIDAIGDNISPAYPRPRDSEFLAQWALETRTGADQVEALGWEGDSGDPEGARITLRITVHVDGYLIGFLGGKDYVKGDSTRCWELTVFGFRNYDTLRTAEIGCPPDAVAVTPSPDPLPDFPADLEARLDDLLLGATSADIDSRLEAAFPGDSYSLDWAERDGELVVTVGIAEIRECALGVRKADGTVAVNPGIDIIPGESSCSPDLYFNPVRTH